MKFQILRLNVTGLKRTIHIFIEMIFRKIERITQQKKLLKKIIENKKLPYSRLLDQQKC